MRHPVRAPPRTGYYIPKLLEEAIGAKFDLSSPATRPARMSISPSSAARWSAVSFTITAFHAREPYFTWRKRNFVRVLYQTGNKRDPRLKDVPTMYELMDRYKTPANRCAGSPR